MDFSHIVSVPEPDYPKIFHNKIKSLVPSQYHCICFDQDQKLRNLHQQKTKKMVYVYMDTIAVPVPEGQENNINLWSANIKVSLQEFNAIAGDIPVTILSPVTNAKECYIKQCSKINITPNVKNWITTTKRDITWCWQTSFPHHKATIDYDCDYLFTITNGKTKLPRLLMMKELWDNHLLDKALWSWCRLDKDKFSIHDTLHLNTTFPYLKSKTLDDIQLDENYVPDNNQGPWPMIFGYTECYIDVMVEYMGGPDQIFITEKTFRPYLNCKPCIQLAHYGHYDALKSIGVKLYDEMFDYDIVEQPSITKRISGIVKNLQRLSLLNKQEMNDLIKKIEPKIRHNYELFLNLSPEPLPTKELNWLWDNWLLPNDMWTNIRLDNIQKTFTDQ